MKMLLSLLASNKHGEKLMANDVSRAFFCAPPRGRVFVELAADDRTADEDFVGELNFSVYGTRGAAQNWGEEYTDKLLKLGFAQGNASPCTFCHASRGLRTLSARRRFRDRW